MVEVRVGVVALAHLLDGKIEDFGREPLASPLLDGHCLFPFELEARGERSLGDFDLLRRRLRGREACWSSWPGFASARASRFSGLRTIQPKISVEAADGDELRPEPCRACGRAQAQRDASVLPIAVVTRSGPSRCEPQRLCSFVARFPCS